MATTKSEGSGDLITTMLGDARVLRYLEKIKDPDLTHQDFEDLLGKVMIRNNVDKGALLKRFKSAEDYQNQLELTSILQAHLDALLEVNHDISVYHRKWSEHYRNALKYVNTVYGNELNLYKDSTRAAIISSVLNPIEAGIAMLEANQDQGEKIQTHMVNAMWTLKEVNGIIRDCLQQQRLSTNSTII